MECQRFSYIMCMSFALIPNPGTRKNDNKSESSVMCEQLHIHEHICKHTFTHIYMDVVPQLGHTIPY
jgi:hypothetical protein